MKKKSIDSSLKVCQFLIPVHFKSNDIYIQTLINTLKAETCLEKQQIILKNIGYHASAYDLLGYLFLTTNSKYPIKKTICRILCGIEKGHMIDCLRNQIIFFLNDVKDKSYEEKNEVIVNLQYCYSSIPAGAKAIALELESVVRLSINLLVDYIENFSSKTELTPSKLEEIQNYIANIVKFFVSISQLEEIKGYLRRDCEKILIATFNIIIEDTLQFEVKCNTAIILVQTINSIQEDSHCINQFQTPCFEILIKLEEQFQQLDESSYVTAKISIYTAILQLLAGNNLKLETINGVPITLYLFENLLSIAKGSLTNPSHILTVTKTLGLFSNLLKSLPQYNINFLFKLGMDYLWSNLDYHIDSIRQKTREVFKHFIKLAVIYGNKGDATLITVLLSYYNDILSNRSTHYVAFNLLAEETGIWFVLQYFNNLPITLLMHLQDSALAPAICCTYEVLMERHFDEVKHSDIWTTTWIEFLKHSLKKSTAPTTGYYQRLLISSFQINPAVFFSIEEYQYVNVANELGALLGCVRLARRNNICLEAVKQHRCYFNGSHHVWRDLLEYSTLERNVCHISDEIRINILALVVECQKSTELFSVWEMQFLKRFFQYNVTSQVPSTVQQIKSLYKKALTRIKEGQMVIQRQLNALNKMVQAKPELLKDLNNWNVKQQNYLEFLETFILEHLKVGILPWSNHYRRSFCLEIIHAIQPCVPLKLWETIWTPKDLKNLYVILDDSYEGNIILATSIIKSIPRTQHKTIEEVKYLINAALTKATSVKVAGSLSAAYFFSLSLQEHNAYEALNSLEEDKYKTDVTVLAINLLVTIIKKELEVSKQNIIVGAKSSPIYGLLFCIRHLIDTQISEDYPYWSKFVKKIIQLCLEISEVVTPVVNNVSPEGYLPEESLSDIEETDETLIAQMVLVYAWRAVKEISLLFGLIAEKAPFGNQILDVQCISDMSDYYKTTFFETKHRGAYEQAYLGFCKLCNRLWKITHNELRQWPKIWVNRIINILKGNADDGMFNKLCSTRRSAGLPFMILAILSTEPATMGNIEFHKCMKTLIRICEDFSLSNEKVVTHTINILRAIYRQSQLSDLVSPYVENGIRIAINGFNNLSWGVRNSATLLFSALMTKIFGVQRNKDSEQLSLKNKMASRVFFMRYPTLFTFLLEKLREGACEKSDNLSTHPVLLVLARLYPTNEEDEGQLIQYLPLVNVCLGHCHYKIRELAALASVSIIPRKRFRDYIIKILVDLSNCSHDGNFCQGLLLQLSQLLRAIHNNIDNLEISPYIENTLWIYLSTGRFISHNTSALYLDLIIEMTNRYADNSLKQPIFTKIGEIILWQIIYEKQSNFIVTPGENVLKRNRLSLIFQIVNILSSTAEYIKTIFIKEFIYFSVESRDMEVSEYVFNFIYYLFLTQTKWFKSSLYILNILDFSENVNSVVQKLNPHIRANILKSLHGILDYKIKLTFFDLPNRNKCYIVKLFLVLQTFGCRLRYLNFNFCDTMSYFLKWCNDGDDSIVCASLGCLNVLLSYSTNKEIASLNLNNLIKVMIHYSSPTSTLHERLAICHLLLQNKNLFYGRNNRIEAVYKIQLWNTVIILLEDNDQIVRNTISTLYNTDVNNAYQDVEEMDKLELISEKAREGLIECISYSLPYKDAINLLLVWILRKQYTRTDDEQVDYLLDEVLFHKGELNTFAEDECLNLVATSSLTKLLWRLPEKLNYQDKSIFIEEHRYLIANVLYNSISQSKSSLMSTELKITCLCILKRLIHYLEYQPINQPNSLILIENTLIKQISSVTEQKNSAELLGIKRFVILFTRLLFNIESRFPR